jgi:hypothetical protein
MWRCLTRCLTSLPVYADLDTMDSLANLESLSLVNRVCTELANNCGVNDSTLGNSLLTETLLWIGSVRC